MKTAEKEIMWGEHKLDWDVFNEGRQASKDEKRGNPYPKNTNSWYSWNAGWNSYEPQTLNTSGK